MNETKLDRLEAETGCELAELVNPTARQRARRLLDCDDPPRGDDREYCRAVAAGERDDDEAA